MAEATIRAGVAERRVEIDQQRGEMIATLIRTVFGEPELGLPSEQQSAGLVVAAKHLRLLSGGS